MDEEHVGLVEVLQPEGLGLYPGRQPFGRQDLLVLAQQAGEQLDAPGVASGSG
jgi:hypothetical protein